MKVIKLNESDIQRIVKRVLREQEEYLVSGTKFNMFGSHRIDIKVINKSTSEIIISVGGEGSSEKEAYDKAVESFNKKCKEKGLNLQPPTIDKLKKSN
jgi:curli biogenesis system outer membrane secretion channel CsgG